MRHSVPEVREDVPVPECRLTDEGRELCLPLAEALRDYGPGSVFASREPKANETAAALCVHLGWTFETLDGLHEHERRRAGFVQGGIDGLLAQLFARPDELVFGDETANQATARFSAAVDGALEGSDGDLFVVAHRTVIVLLVAARTGVEPLPLWQRLGSPSYVVLSLPEWRIEEVVPSV